MFIFKLERQRIKMYPDELANVLEYQERLSRRLDPEVDSSCGPTNECTIILSAERDGRVTFAGTVQGGRVL